MSGDDWQAGTANGITVAFLGEQGACVAAGGVSLNEGQAHSPGIGSGRELIWIRIHLEPYIFTFIGYKHYSNDEPKPVTDR